MGVGFVLTRAGDSWTLRSIVVSVCLAVLVSINGADVQLPCLMAGVGLGVE